MNEMSSQNHPPSTTEILALQVLGRSIDERWPDWAISMLVQGCDTPHLRILAGLMPPFDRFETTRIFERAFSELNLHWGDRSSVLRAYIIELLLAMLRGDMSAHAVLSEIEDVYLELHHDPLYDSFHLLHHAWIDLKDSEFQYYWRGANRENIEETVRMYAVEWLSRETTVDLLDGNRLTG